MRRQAAGAAVGVALGAVLLGQYPSLSPVTIVQVAVAVRLVASVFQWIATGRPIFLNCRIQSCSCAYRPLSTFSSGTIVEPEDNSPEIQV